MTNYPNLIGKDKKKLYPYHSLRLNHRVQNFGLSQDRIRQEKLVGIDPASALKDSLYPVRFGVGADIAMLMASLGQISMQVAQP